MSTLIIKNDGIGDLILSSGIIGELAEKLGSVDLVTCGQNKEIAEMIPGLRRRLYVSRDGIRLRFKPLKLGIIWPLVPAEDKAVIREIRQEHYERVIVLRRYIRTSSMVLANSAKTDSRIGCWLFPTNLPAWAARRMSLSWENYNVPRAGFEMDCYRGFIEKAMKIGLNGKPKLKLAPEPDALANAGKRIIGLCIGGAIDRWPVARWTELALRLHRHADALFIFGGPECKKPGHEIVQLCTKATNFCGRLSFTESVPLLSQCSLLISNDTGFAHFATMVGCEVLIVKGGGGHDRFVPWPNANNQKTIYRKLDCYDCDWRCAFSEKYCLTQISADHVSASACNILSGTQESRHVDISETVGPLEALSHAFTQQQKAE